MMEKKIVAFVEIFVLIFATLAFAYIVNQTDDLFALSQDESKLVKEIRGGLISYFGSNLVSATEGVWTCPVNLNGSVCQEYPYVTCQANCNSTCFEGARRDFAPCREGTCIDPSEGTCSPNTPRALCDQSGGLWREGSPNEVPACRKGCCLAGSQASFVTETSCNVLRQRTGVPYEFRPVGSELECLSLANSGDEGACVLDANEFERHNCRFSTQSQCRGLGGVFYKGLLCSNPALNTTCTKQISTGCVEGKDEVYWFDSCGNKENIYDSLHKDDSWNSGRVLDKNESCSLGLGTNPLVHQASCGNCNYLEGNRCGSPRAGIDDTPSIGNFVCRDLACTDENGVKHKHGESWCVFNSQIGTQGSAGNGQRSIDLPGSEQFRRTCANGEITTETCGTFRNQVCVSSSVGTGSDTFSTAACRPNQWQLCLAANQKAEGITDAAAASAAVREECNKHTDCFVKSVDLTGGKGTFAFSVCEPRYPPGFDTRSEFNNGEEAQALCSFGSVTCKYVKVKKLFGKSEYNKVCLQNAGAEAMNNLCMSIGDCGADINTAGEFSGSGFRVTTDSGSGPGLSQTYIQGLQALKTPRAGQHVEPLNENETDLLFGNINSIGDPALARQKGLQQFAMISGIGGIGLLLAWNLFPETITSAGLHTGLIGNGVCGATCPGMQASMGAYMGAAAGALIGAAGTAYLLHAFGIDAGLPAGVTYALIGLGAYGGAVIGFNLLGGTSSLWAFSMAAGIWAIVIVIVIIAIFSFLGIGKKKEINVKFQCLPWQPPLGGAHCNECGKNGLPCSKYACQSLGAACQYLEDSAEEPCVNSGIDDVSPPIISPNPAVLVEGYSYEAVTPNGFRLKGTSSSGCVPRFSEIRLGIRTSELGQCKVANEHSASFDEMVDYFHQQNGRQSNLFRTNHTMIFSIPGSEAVQNEHNIDEDTESNPDETYRNFFLPDSSGNVNLYVRCTDASGNKNAQEYAINFCVSPEPDRTAPIISQFSPPSPAFIALNASSRNVNFFVNEPAECRWSDLDQDYSVMTNNASCLNGLGDSGLFGWPCNVSLPAPASGVNERSFYFRCSDMPWINATDPSVNASRNTNQQSTVYTLKSTRNPLRIVSVSPNNETIFTNGLPVVLNLTVTTSGGADGMARFCYYQSGSLSIPFFITGDDFHIQPNLRLFAEGNYSYPIRCSDVVGNDAYSESRFSIEVDDTGPEITRVYSQSNRLNVITNERGRCAFSLTTCGFTFENGTAMQDDGLVHSSPLSGNGLYHIICRDIFDNPSACLVAQGGRLS